MYIVGCETPLLKKKRMGNRYLDHVNVIWVINKHTDRICRAYKHLDIMWRYSISELRDLIYVALPICLSFIWVFKIIQNIWTNYLRVLTCADTGWGRGLRGLLFFLTGSRRFCFFKVEKLLRHDVFCIIFCCSVQ